MFVIEGHQPDDVNMAIAIFNMRGEYLETVEVCSCSLHTINAGTIPYKGYITVLPIPNQEH
jgi:hypothetical protein